MGVEDCYFIVVYHPSSYQPRNLNSSQVFDNFLLYIIREHAVGNPSAIVGQTANILIREVNGTLSAMLNEFAGIRKVLDQSLGRDETPRHTSHEI